MLRFIIACALIALQWPAQVFAESYITYRVTEPGANYGTEVIGINDKGNIAGDWADVLTSVHGFVRNAATGQVTSFDYPFRGLTYVRGFNAAGIIVGYFQVDTSLATEGYVRAADGRTSTLKILNSYQTILSAINTSGAITGSFQITKDALPSGFILTPSRQLITFSASSQYPLKPTAINDSMDVTGTYGGFGYLRLANGTQSTFSAPATKGETFTSPVAINNSGEIVGFAKQTVCWRNNCFPSQARGFIRYPNGLIRLFTVPGSTETYIYDVNDAGTIVGYFIGPGGQHGFMCTATGQITQLDVPGQDDTVATAINNNNIIAGIFGGRKAGTFIRTP